MLNQKVSMQIERYFHIGNFSKRRTIHVSGTIQFIVCLELQVAGDIIAERVTWLYKVSNFLQMFH